MFDDNSRNFKNFVDKDENAIDFLMEYTSLAIDFKFSGICLKKKDDLFLNIKYRSWSLRRNFQDFFDFKSHTIMTTIEKILSP